MLLSGVTWEGYIALLQELGDDRAKLISERYAIASKVIDIAARW